MRVRFSWIIAGIFTGMAELLPGISGGTVILLCGLYDRLVGAISTVTRIDSYRGVKMPVAEWQFLGILGISMLATAVLMAAPVLYLYRTYPLSFKVGVFLVVATALLPLLRALPVSSKTLAFLVVGVLISVMLTWSGTFSFSASENFGTALLLGFLVGILLSLPGVSGSYFLLLVGFYPIILNAVVDAKWAILLPFLSGVIVGVVLVARLMQRLLRTYAQILRPLLYGLVLGSFYALIPSDYESLPALGLAVIAGLAFGGALLWLQFKGNAARGKGKGKGIVTVSALLLATLCVVPGQALGQDESASSGWGSYAIQKGENLGIIANLYQVSVSDLVKWNQLGKSSRIYYGKQLVMPLDTKPRTHRVKKGDTLSGIALQYRTFVKRLSSINGLASGNLIYPGQILQLAPDLQPAIYVVKHNDTLWSVALRYNLQMDELISVNNIQAPFVIYPGQKIFLYGKDNSFGRRLPPINPQAVSKTAADAPSGTVEDKPRKQVSKAPSAWTWPVKGRISKHYHPIEYKGIDILGQKDQPVYAAADGVVRYAGNGLYRDYGWLVILAHGPYLSVYAHNNKLLVAEGQVVKSGQQIAELGKTGTDRFKLHFQIKLNSRPTDPISLLPKLPQLSKDSVIRASGR
ncbi:MAG: undecaprenyl phosphate translocase family protein [Gammaproteobacteria bacterium]